MAALENLNTLDEEIQELIRNSKWKKASFYEPCTAENISDCLIGLHEELALFNIRYLFNPYVDLEGGTLSREATVRLVNACWSLLQHHKEVSSAHDISKDRTYSLQQNNYFLNTTVDRLKDKILKLESELKQCRTISEQIADKATAQQKELAHLKQDLKRTQAQKETKEHQLTTNLRKMESQYLSLQDKFRGQCGVYTSRNEAKNQFVEDFKIKERKYKETITKLQQTNRQLIEEVLGLKEELVLSAYDGGEPLENSIS